VLDIGEIGLSIGETAIDAVWSDDTLQARLAEAGHTYIYMPRWPEDPPRGRRDGCCRPRWPYAVPHLELDVTTLRFRVDANR